MSLICPPKFYTNIRQGGAQESLKVLSVTLSLAVGSNLTAIAAIPAVLGGTPALSIRVLAYKIQSTASTVSGYLFKNGSGGPSLDGGQAPPNTGQPLIMPPWDAGYFETSPGTGLFVDITTHTTALQLYYVTYAP